MYYSENDFQIVEEVKKLAKKLDHSPAQIALAWLLQKEGIRAPIIGATKMPQLEEAVEALEISLSDKEIKLLEDGYVPHPVLGHS